MIIRHPSYSYMYKELIISHTFQCDFSFACPGKCEKHHKGADYVVHCPICMYCVIMMRINAFLIVLLAHALYMMVLRVYPRS